jgi:hypothetical protein
MLSRVPQHGVIQLTESVTARNPAFLSSFSESRVPAGTNRGHTSMRSMRSMRWGLLIVWPITESLSA